MLVLITVVVVICTGSPDQYLGPRYGTRREITRKRSARCGEGLRNPATGASGLHKSCPKKTPGRGPCQMLTVLNDIDSVPAAGSRNVIPAKNEAGGAVATPTASSKSWRCFHQSRS